MTNKLLKWFFFIQCQILLLLVYTSDGFEGGADAICHWLISRDALSDPMYFLDQWNKPLFTVFTTFFAQFGLIGMRVFSALVGVLTGYVLSKSVEEQLGELSWAVAVLLLLIPQYLTLLTSSMTEPLFALFLSLFILCVAKKKLAAAALIAGLTPFVRQEGMALIPIAALVLGYLREWKKTPLLLIGTMVVALVGWSVSGDVLWILTSFPYGSGSSDIYGSGEWYHYLSYYRVLFGIPISILFIIGSGFLIERVLNRVKNRIVLTSFELASVAAFAFGLLFFSAHSYVWWKGVSGSLGLIRVMACIAPSVALIAAYGIQRLLELPFAQNPPLKLGALGVVLGLAISQVVAVTDLPTPLGEAQKVMRSVGQWLKDEQVKGKVHYYDAVFYYFAEGGLDIDSPINKKPLYASEINDLTVADIVVWDAHFSPNEGRLPLDTLLYHPYLEKIKSFKPERAFTVLGNRPYAVHVFRKTDQRIEKRMSSRILAIQNFENDDAEFKIETLKGRNDSRCAVADDKHQFITIRKNLSNSDVASAISYQLEAWVWSEKPLNSGEFSLVSDINHNGVGIHYLSTGSDQIKNYSTRKWNRISQSFELPATLPNSFELKCYIWNPGSETLLIDDLKLEVLEIKKTDSSLDL